MLINHIYNGDSLYVLQELDENSIDAVVTDPPYGISFMGKKWDYDVPSVELWKEVLRVLKPGGHALVACGTRTQHRMAVNLEDAGFEIRDLIAWIYGSGFPKSLNIAYAIEGKLKTGSSNVKDFKKLEGKEYNQKTGYVKLQAEQGYRPDYSDTVSKKPNLTTQNAKQFEGFGTALKPAMELWTLCRKPISEKNIAENVLKHGTGGINIDGCRIETQGVNEVNYRKNYEQHAINRIKENKFLGQLEPRKDKNGFTTLGRFPANVIHDGSEEVLAGFPETVSKWGKSQSHHIKSDIYLNGMYRDEESTINKYIGDSGSAARFFYTAKASKSERNAGLDGFEEKTKPFGNQAIAEIKRGNDPKETAKMTNHISKMSNHHPTVKPISLMRYLCKLITPPNGVVLDCFCGSGTTGAAAILEGFDFIGIERDSEYVEIARARINDKRNLFKQEIF